MPKRSKTRRNCLRRLGRFEGMAAACLPALSYAEPSEANEDGRSPAMPDRAGCENGQHNNSSEHLPKPQV